MFGEGENAKIQAMERERQFNREVRINCIHQREWDTTKIAGRMIGRRRQKNVVSRGSFRVRNKPEIIQKFSKSLTNSQRVREKRSRDGERSGQMFGRRKNQTSRRHPQVAHSLYK